MLCCLPHLFSKQPNFETVAKSLATTLTLATDGLDLREYFFIQAKYNRGNGSCDDPYSYGAMKDNTGGVLRKLPLLEPTWSWIYLIAFVFVGPIILTNMLVSWEGKEA